MGYFARTRLRYVSKIEGAGDPCSAALPRLCVASKNAYRIRMALGRLGRTRDTMGHPLGAL
ncbi:MAG: hypothetical protein BWX67_00807 [Thermotogae bacterium ADurb.Bin062]|jgi:hypothetical protein|nr:MAG: hypothetical protein BWX67_00807 [Thermotogota bacterium ADurb.Bin062]